MIAETRTYQFVKRVVSMAKVQASVCFEVEEILGVSVGIGNVKNYCVRWAPTWVSALNLVGCEQLIEQFLQQQKQEEEKQKQQEEEEQQQQQREQQQQQ